MTFLHVLTNTKSGATLKECNDRILIFLEDRFSRHCEYDEFIAILRNLVDMPHAQTILDQMQKNKYVFEYEYSMYI